MSYLDISISICGGKYVTEVYDKRDDFNFDIVNFSYVCSNIPAKPTYGVYISQLIRICRICDNYSSFLSRHKLLTERLVRQGFWYNKLCITFKKFARRYNVLISKYGVSIRAHVTEGICIPLVAKPDLIRNITFLDLKAGHVDHLLTCVYFSTLCLLLLYCCLLFIFLPIFVFLFF